MVVAESMATTGPEPSFRLTSPPARQRRELTFKVNALAGRHGWLRLTPAYSVHLVAQILDREQVQEAVFDPFSGSATTPLAAATRGHRAFSTDINPFLVWLGSLKVRCYRPSELAAAERARDEALALLESGQAQPTAPPPIRDIERWWAAPQLDFLCRLSQAIARVSAPGSVARDLLTVSLCRTMIAVSNAAFNHQSMSFKSKGVAAGGTEEPLARFRADAELVLASARDNPRGEARVLGCDARTLEAVEPRSFDLLVTSPPYPNRMSYIRELRPYMYWTGYLTQARQAAELDWQAIGGTWGVATSRVKRWQPPEGHARGDAHARCVRDISECGAPNAVLLSRYVDKYFFDIERHLTAAAARIRQGGRVHYVVGNSTFYGVLVPTEGIYAALLERLGFRGVEVTTLRKRNSKKELFEFDVSGVWA